MYIDIINKINVSLKNTLEFLLKDQDIDTASISQKLSLEINKTFKFGEFSSNMAMQLAKPLKNNPRAIAQSIIEQLENSEAKAVCKKIEIAGPGFINFYLADEQIPVLMKEILAKKENYGKQKDTSEKILMEYVSANPTGPLTLAHARQAAVGDTMANIFSHAGYEVLREYYLNDRGLQIETLGKSTYARYLELLGENVTFEESYYQGEYVKDIARELIDKEGEKYKDDNEVNAVFFQNLAKDTILDSIKTDLNDFDVEFDNWFSEGEFAEGPAIDAMLTELKEKDVVYESEGALWFRSTDFGDDKDRVLIRSNGEKTYVTPDIAYHKNKFNRGYDRLINLLGPDHHGYIARIKAGVEALGFNPDNLDIVIIQLATLYKNGKKLSMSTRAGEFITLRDILDEVGKDAGRFFLIMRKTDSHLEFDLDLAKEQSSNNPVFYVQYGHARICSIFRKYQETTGKNPTDINVETLDYSLLNEADTELIKTITLFNKVIQESAASFDPQKVPIYLSELVAVFHSYYNKNKVLTEDANLTDLRICVLASLLNILKCGLKMIGCSAPEKM